MVVVTWVTLGTAEKGGDERRREQERNREWKRTEKERAHGKSNLFFAQLPVDHFQMDL